MMEALKKTMTPSEAEDLTLLSEEEADELIDELKSMAKYAESPTDFMQNYLKVQRQFIRDMKPEERREMCNDLKADFTDRLGNDTGRFFLAIAGAKGKADPDYRELGKRIMEKRNANYRPEKQKGER